MRKKNKNIYMGPQSTAHLPVFGKVDTSNEICLNAIATAYDALNNKMLARNIGMFDETTIKEINGRFHVLRGLCTRYAPSKIMIIDKIQKITLDNFKGKISDQQAISMLQQITRSHGLDPNTLNIAALHVDQAEQRHTPIAFDPFGINMFVWYGEPNSPKMRRKR